MERERYSEEDKAELRTLIKNNAKLGIVELLELAGKAMPKRSEAALRQQLFKLRRDGSKKGRGAKREKLETKSAGKPVAMPKKRRGRPPARMPADMETGYIAQHEPKKVAPPVNGSNGNHAELTLHIGGGTHRVTGSPEQVAKLLQSLN